MRNRSLVLVVTLALVILPALLAVGEAAWYRRWIAENGTIVSSGLERSFFLYVPASYDGSKPTPLVISIHGAGMRAVAHMHTSQWNRVADRHGFIVVYPSAMQGRGPAVWEYNRTNGVIANVQFIADLIDHIAASYNIDRTRIYANGLSNGGGMSFVLSCTMSDRIAAVGLVGAAFTVPWEWCTDDTPVPMIAFHGTDDWATPYHGGKTWVVPSSGMPFPDIPTYVENWSRRNRCVGAPTETRVAPDATRRSYGSCANDASVDFYTIEGGGHTWPGGGPLPEWFVGTTTKTIDASRVMWDFFREHPLQ